MLMDSTDLHTNVDRLFRACGQKGMESAIAGWYLKKAAIATCQDAFDDAIGKARSLDQRNTLLWMAEDCHRDNNFTDASQYYLQAFHANPSNRSHWQAIGDYLLRYGTSDQVVDLFSQVSSTDSKNHYARFILDCYEYFEILKQEIGTRILCAETDSGGISKLMMQVAVWGPRYTDIFLDYLLPALCAPGNLPSMAQKRQMHFIVCTDTHGAKVVEQHASFAEVKKYARPHIITLSPRLFDYAKHVARSNGGGWTIPTTLLTNAAHYSVLECGRRMNRDVLNFSPDLIVSNRFMTELDLALEDDVHAITGPGFRLYDEPRLLEEIETRYRNAKGTLEISPSEMVRLLDSHLPEANFVHAEQFSEYPIYLCWRVPGEGVIAHVNHYHPWVVRGRGLDIEVQLSLDPIDGNFLNRTLVDKNEVTLAPPAMMSFDLGKNPLCLPTGQNRFDPRKVAQWVRPFLSPVHEQYFRNPLFYSLNESTASAQWLQTAAKAGLLVEEIITGAKNAPS